MDDRKVVIEYDPQARNLRLVTADDSVQWMYSQWFAGYAFHPKTSVFESHDR